MLRHLSPEVGALTALLDALSPGVAAGVDCADVGRAFSPAGATATTNAAAVIAQTEPVLMYVAV
jgi:hypothetical protein